MGMGNRTFYGLGSTLTISLVAKFALFLAGVAVIGLTSTRGQLTACGSTAPGNPPIFSAPFPDAEAYTDYRDLYLRCLVNPFLSGRSAYNLPIVYNYPPLFLYLLSAFAEIGYIWGSAIPLVLFDALTVIPLYLIAKEFIFHGDKKKAFAVSLLWIFNPLNLFYNDLMWLNPGPTTFFLVLSIYLFLKQSWIGSSLSLAISTGLKQPAVLIFPIFLVWMIRMPGISRKKILAFTLLYISALVVISTPYVFQEPQTYFWALQLPIFGSPPGASSGYPATFVYDLSQPTRLTTFFGLVQFVNLKSFAVSSYYALNDVFGVAYAILLLQLGVGLGNLWKLLRYYAAVAKSRITHGFRSSAGSISAPVITDGQSLSANNLLVYCLTAMLLMLSLFGRGSYKYYFAGITPLALPLFASRRGGIIFEVFCAALILLPREVTPWFGILMITMIPSMIGRSETSPASFEGTEVNPSLEKLGTKNEGTTDRLQQLVSPARIISVAKRSQSVLKRTRCDQGAGECGISVDKKTSGLVVG